MSKVDVFNCVRSAIPFPTGNETTTGVSQNENSVSKNYKSGVATQFSVEIRPDNSHTYATATHNKNSVFFDGCSQAKGVENRLTSNIEKTAESFLSQSDLQRKISEKFETQLESLSKCCSALNAKVSDEVNRFDELSAEKKFILGSAIAKINDLVCRLSNDSVGGIDKLNANTFKDSTKYLIEVAQRYEDAEIMENSEDRSVRKEGERLKKAIEKEAFITKGVAEENLNALKKNLELLKNFSQFPAPGRGNVEKMLNFIQQCALSAWVFNDVAECLNNDRAKIITEEQLEDMGILSEKNKEMKALNKKARETMMFKEFKINDLIKDAKLAIDGSFNGGKVRNFLEEWGEEKIGFRGRHGVDKNDERVSSKPIGNTKNEVGTFQNGSLFEKFIRDQNFEGAIVIRGSVVPGETANLKTVPDKMLEDLKGILHTKEGQKIAELLKKEGLIEATVTSIGGVFRLSDLEAKPSFASFINDAGLPTYCSVSGTTGEIVSVLHCTLKDKDRKSPLTPVFDNLLKIADGIWPDPPFNFSTYFAPIATFMEVGHFHTTGEVLGGFLSVAVADRNVKNEAEIRLHGGDEAKIKQEIERKKEDASEFRFKNLLNYFNCHQELFLAPVGEEPAQVWTTVPRKRDAGIGF